MLPKLWAVGLRHYYCFHIIFSLSIKDEWYSLQINTNMNNLMRECCLTLQKRLSAWCHLKEKHAKLNLPQSLNFRGKKVCNKANVAVRKFIAWSKLTQNYLEQQNVIYVEPHYKVHMYQISLHYEPKWLMVIVKDQTWTSWTQWGVFIVETRMLNFSFIRPVVSEENMPKTDDAQRTPDKQVMTWAWHKHLIFSPMVNRWLIAWTNTSSSWGQMTHNEPGHTLYPFSSF